jgi:dihydroxyacid dehydratase/phosphogluconate dehydratase
VRHFTYEASYRQDDDSSLRSIAEQAAFEITLSLNIAMGWYYYFFKMLAAALKLKVISKMADIDRLSRRVLTMKSRLLTEIPYGGCIGLVV